MGEWSKVLRMASVLSTVYLSSVSSLSSGHVGILVVLSAFMIFMFSLVPPPPPLEQASPLSLLNMSGY